MKIALDKLVVTKENPRHTPASAASHAALVASLGTHGLIQPLVVRPLEDGHDSQHWEVIAGTRRLAALTELGWTEAECVENDAEYGISELGAAENMLREAMHPLDECAVISRLVADGEAMDAVAGRFGQTERWVEQRIKLASLAPKIAKYFREGHLGLAAAQAYCLVDRKAQEHYFGEGKKDHQVSASAIAAAFSKASYNAKNAMFRLEDYPQTQIRRDLFGDDVWLDDRDAYNRLQKTAIIALKQKILDEEGWSDVILLMDGPDYTITGKYVKVTDKILKADRSKYVVLVVYSPGSGACVVERGYVLRKDTKKVTPGATAASDTTSTAEVEAKTADNLSLNQAVIVAAHQTAGIEQALADGDIHTALLTLLGPFLSHDFKAIPPWCGGRRHLIDYDPVNAMLPTAGDQLENQDDEDATYKLPSREALEKMRVSELGDLLCNTALRAMIRIPMPSALAAKQLKAAEIDWMRMPEGFLKRYRLDQLHDLAKRMKVDVENLGKADTVKALTNAAKGMQLGRILKLETE